jgi:hypothetical protein
MTPQTPSSPEPRRPRWRRAAPHLAALTLAEWALSLALGHHVTAALREHLEAHPIGADALASEHGRIALEQLAFHADALSARGSLVIVGVALYALATIPLHGVLPALALDLPDNPWERSIRHTLPLLGLGLLSLAATVTSSVALQPVLTRLVTNPPMGPQPRTIALTALLALLVLLAALIVRVVLAFARAAVVYDMPLSLALRAAWAQWSSRPLGATLSHLLVLVWGASLAALVSFVPATIATAAALLAHAARVGAEFHWLARNLDIRHNQM